MRSTAAGWVDVQARSSGSEDGLVAIAAAGEEDAWAVGFTTFQQVQRPLVMRWDGGHWRVDRPQPPGSLASVLTAPLGARTAHRMDIRPLRRLFALVLYVLAGYFLLR